MKLLMYKALNTTTSKVEKIHHSRKAIEAFINSKENTNDYKIICNFKTY